MNITLTYLRPLLYTTGPSVQLVLELYFTSFHSSSCIVKHNNIDNYTPGRGKIVPRNVM